MLDAPNDRPRVSSRSQPHFLLGLASIIVTIVSASLVMSQELRDVSENAATTDEASANDVDARYFGKRLELARHDLDSALEANRRIPNLNSKLTLLRLRNQVAYATKLLQQAGKTTEHDLHQSHLQSVQNDVVLAEQQLAWAEGARGFLREDQVKRYRLSAELARLALERAQQPDITSDPLDHLQWQIDRLRSELLSLQLEFERTRSGQ